MLVAVGVVRVVARTLIMRTRFVTELCRSDAERVRTTLKRFFEVMRREVVVVVTIRRIDVAARRALDAGDLVGQHLLVQFIKSVDDGAKNRRVRVNSRSRYRGLLLLRG